MDVQKRLAEIETAMSTLQSQSAVRNYVELVEVKERLETAAPKRGKKENLTGVLPAIARAAADMDSSTRAVWTHGTNTARKRKSVVTKTEKYMNQIFAAMGCTPKGAATLRTDSLGDDMELTLTFKLDKAPDATQFKAVTKMLDDDYGLTLFGKGKSVSLQFPVPMTDKEMDDE